MKKSGFWLFAVLFLGIVLLVVMLYRASAVESAHAPAAAGADPQKLLIPRWFLTELVVDGQTVKVPAGQQQVTIQFEPGGSANGTGGCNNFSTTYTANADGSMRFGPVISTKMACAENMDLENAYFLALDKVERFQTDAHPLVLSSADGQTRLVFSMPPK